MVDRNETALITGASKGIGKEFAKLLAQKGYNLFLIALEQDLLEQLAEQLRREYGVQVHIYAKDLATTNASQDILRETNHKNLSINMLINNAGIGVKGDFCQSDPMQIQATMHVNMVALTELTRIFAPQMIKAGYGRILNMSSTSAFQPGPGMAVYFASKAYVLSLSQALNKELSGTGVIVTALCPGPTITEFAKNANLSHNPIHSGIAPLWEAKDVAAYGYKVLMRGKRMATVGFINTIYGFLARIAPKGIVMDYIKRLHDK